MLPVSGRRGGQSPMTEREKLHPDSEIIGLSRFGTSQHYPTHIRRNTFGYAAAWLRTMDRNPAAGERERWSPVLTWN